MELARLDPPQPTRAHEARGPEHPRCSAGWAAPGQVFMSRCAGRPVFCAEFADPYLVGTGAHRRLSRVCPSFPAAAAPRRVHGTLVARPLSTGLDVT